MDDALRAAGLGKRYRRRWALRSCDLAVPAGSIAALVGPNGAGKTTLLKLAAGLLRPTTGHIEVAGRRPGMRGTPVGTSFLGQQKPLFDGFSVAEMVRAAGVLNAGARWDGGYAEQLVDAAGIAVDERIGALSPGGRTRVALALALGRRPDVLLLDEPLAELDPLARRQVMGTLLAEATETGMTVLLSSHVLPDLENSCDRIVLLRDGRVRLEGDIETLLDEHSVLVGPAGAGPPGGAVHVSTSGRQTTVLVRGDHAVSTEGGFEGGRPSLDDLVLAYLQETDS